MTTASDRLFVNPAPDGLAAALDDASGNTPSPQSARRWRPILDEVANNAEGRSQMEHIAAPSHGTRYLTVAWWTDHQGRKLVRVAAGQTGEGHQRHHSRLDRDPRPPVWHVGPERIYRAHRPGREPGWVACCTCGEVGLPAAIAWTGERCGGCHDRREEGLAVEERPALIELGRTVQALAFGPDGDRLAVSTAGRVVEVLDLRDASSLLLHEGGGGAEWEDLRPAAWSADGRWVVAADPREGQAHLWLWGAKGLEIAASLDESCGWWALGHTRALDFSPDGTVLAACFEDGASALFSLEGHFAPILPAAVIDDPHEVAQSLAFSPDGRSLAVGRQAGTISTLDAHTGDAIAQQGPAVMGEGVDFISHAPDGRHLVLLTSRGDQDDPLALHLVSPTSTLALWDQATQSLAHSHTLLPPTLVAYSAAANRLALITHHPNRSPAEVAFWDVARWRDAGSLEWDSEDMLTALAFSPDGETLATGSQGGALKLWPWRRLLEG